MTDKELLDYIKENSKSDLAHAYRLGRKTVFIEIDKIEYKLPLNRCGNCVIRIRCLKFQPKQCPNELKDLKE